MRITLLGSVGVTDAPEDAAHPEPGGPLSPVHPLTGRRRQAVLALLALHRGELVSADTLIDAVWGDDPPATAQNTLQAHVSYLRRALGDRRHLLTRPPGYLLDVPARVVDLGLAQACLEAAAALPPGSAAAAAEHLGRALALWRGRPLAELDDLPAFEGHARRLAELRLSTLERWGEARLAAGDTAALVPELERLVAEHPLHEEFHRQLMLALYRSGRQADALAAYRRARSLLDEELGVDPGPGLRALESAVLRQDPSLDLSQHHATTAAPTATTATTVRTTRHPSLPPLPPSSFVGREEELARLADLLDGSPVVTIVATGGAGKTRLALEAAHRIGPRFADGVAFADLTTVESEAGRDDAGAGPAPDAVPRAVARAVAVEEEPGVPIVDTLRAALEQRHCLLVLDNCEHVPDGAAELAESLASTCGGLRILATSREPLRVDGEARLPLAPLPLPGEDDDPSATTGTAVDLLVRRARAADPAFAPSPEEVRTLAELARALDGLPLALELAAARLPQVTAAELLAGLDGTFAALGAGRRTAAPRHRDLAATLRWSLSLLDDTERATFISLAVLRGGAPIAVAAEVASGERGPRGQVPVVSLVEKSLLTRAVEGPESRVAMHATTHRFAQVLLAEDARAEEIHRRHAKAFLALAEEQGRLFHGPGEPKALQVLGRDDANLAAATEWALQEAPDLALALVARLWWYWFRTGRAAAGFRTGLRVVESADRAGFLDHAGFLDNGVGVGPAGTALAGTGYLAWVVDAYETARSLAERALDSAGDDPLAVALATGVLARVAGEGEDLDLAAGLAVQAVERHEAAGDPWGAAWSRRVQAAALLYRGTAGDLEAAEAVCRESRATFEEFGDAWGAAGSLDLLAVIATRRGRPARALALAADALARHRELGDSSGTRYALQHLAEAARAAGALDRAVAAATESLELAREHGYRIGSLQALVLRAEVAYDQGRTASALTDARDAERLARALGDEAYRARAAALLRRGGGRAAGGDLAADLAGG